MKYRALKLDHGNYAWPGEAITRKCRILDVAYNATNKEFVRTNTLVKGSIVQIDSTPFKNWYQHHYGVTIGKATAYQKIVKSKTLKTRKEKDAAEKKAKKDAKTRARREAKKAAAAKAAVKSTKTGKNVKGAAKKMKTSVKGKDGKKGATTKKATTGKKVDDKKTDANKGTEKAVEKKEKDTKVEEGKDTKTATKKETKKDTKKVTKKDSKTVEKTDMQVEKKDDKKSEKKDKKVKGAKGEKGKKQKLRKDAKHQPSGAQMKRWRLRNATRVLEAALAEQFQKGRVYAKISTSPGQAGTADGYVLEGEELAFYVKRLAHKKKR